MGDQGSWGTTGEAVSGFVVHIAIVTKGKRQLGHISKMGN
jgi:hypothetical protein